MAVSKLDVAIKGVVYFLNEVPDESSAVVKAEVGNLLGDIDLQTLVNDLGRVGSFVRIAYNAAGAAGPKFVDTQIDIQRLGYDVTKLCNKSALTISKFKKASSCVLTNLQCTYEYLLNNLEEMALATFSAVRKLAEDMNKAAMELHVEFVAEEEKVVKTLEKTQKSRGKEEERIEQLKTERKEMDLKQKEQEELMNGFRKKEQEAEARRRDLEQKEDAAIADLDSSDPGRMIKEVFNSLTSKVPLLAAILKLDTEGPEKKVAALKKCLLEAHEKEQKLRDKRLEALSKMTDFAGKVLHCDTDENMAKIAVDALRHAIGALKGLSAVMMKAADFWEQMAEHCGTMAKSGIKESVETALSTYTKEERLEIWTSQGFKRQAVIFYAGWVALNSVCKIYIEKIKVTQQDLYRYITENPTCMESRQNLKELSQNFLSDVRNEQKAIGEKDRV